MSASVSGSISVRKESWSDDSDVLGTSFCKGGAAKRSHYIATVAYMGGFSVSVAVSKINRHFVYKLHYLCLQLTLFSLVWMHPKTGKSDGVSSLSTVTVSTLGSASMLVTGSSITSFT